MRRSKVSPSGSALAAEARGGERQEDPQQSAAAGAALPSDARAAGGQAKAVAAGASAKGERRQRRQHQQQQQEEEEEEEVVEEQQEEQEAEDEQEAKQQRDGVAGAREASGQETGSDGGPQPEPEEAAETASGDGVRSVTEEASPQQGPSRPASATPRRGAAAASPGAAGAPPAGAPARGGAGKKRGRGGGAAGGGKQRGLTETELEEEVATAVGLPPFEFSDEEVEAGLAGMRLNEEQYALVRNHVLARWRYDPTRYLSEEAAAARIHPRCKPLVTTAWEFLDTHGYINFGVAPALTDRGVPERKQSVVVIGAGLAGMSAARQLRNWGYRVLVLEGQDRLGGRVHGCRMQGTDAGGVEHVAGADLGGSIITGIDGNPLAVLARQLGAPLHPINEDVPLFQPDGSEADAAVDKQVHTCFNNLLDKIAAMREAGLSPEACGCLSLEAAFEALWARVRREQPGLWGGGAADGDGGSSGSGGGGCGGGGGGGEGRGDGEGAPAAEEDGVEARKRRRVEGGAPAGGGQEGPRERCEQEHEQRAEREQAGGPPAAGGAAGAAAPVSAADAAAARLDKAVREAAAAARARAAAAAAEAAEAARPLAERLPPSEMRRRLMHWHIANVEFATAARLDALSMRYWDLDDEYEHPGLHVWLPGGNLRLVAALARDIPIMYRCQATLVEYSERQGVVVHTDTGGQVAADATIVTVPLGALKRGCPAFSPPLPPRKAAAIRRLGFGLLNKVMLLFPHCFWGDRDMFGHVQPDPARRGAYYLFYAYEAVSGGSVLAALAAGRAAYDLEGLTDAEATRRVVSVLRGIWGPQGVEVPDPLQSVVTRWGRDPLTWGSYSFVAAGGRGPDDYDALAAPLGRRVFFAGEATTKKYPATMHGAFATGLREAANVAKALGARGSGSAAGAAGARGSGGGVVADKAAGEAADGAGGEGAAGGGGAWFDPAAAAAARRLEELAGKLAEIFGGGPTQQQQQQAKGRAQAQARPSPAADLQLGCIRAVFGPPGSGFEDEAVVAIDTGPSRGAPRGPGAAAGGGGAAGEHSGLHLFAALSRAALEELEDMPGGDEARLAALARGAGAAGAGGVGGGAAGGSGGGGGGGSGGAAAALLAGRRSLSRGRGAALVDAIYAARCGGGAAAGGGGRGSGGGGGGAE